MIIVHIPYGAHNDDVYQTKEYRDAYYELMKHFANNGGWRSTNKGYFTWDTWEEGEIVEQLKLKFKIK